MTTRRYFRAKAKALAKRLQPVEPKPMAPPAKPEFRPITGYRADALKIKVRKIRKRFFQAPYAYKHTSKKVFVQIKLSLHERKQWGNAAADLEMTLSSLMRIAMRRLLASRRTMRQITNGDPDAILVKRISARTLKRRVLREFGIPYSETEYLVEKAPISEKREAHLTRLHEETRRRLDRSERNPTATGSREPYRETSIDDRRIDPVGTSEHDRPAAVEGVSTRAAGAPVKRRLMVVPGGHRG